MTSKDLIHIANILLDCEEMGDAPVIDHINKQCKRFGLTEVKDDIIKIVDRCRIVHNIGSVTYDFSEDTMV